jgi:hypothetical protein
LSKTFFVLNFSSENWGLICFKFPQYDNFSVYYIDKIILPVFCGREMWSLALSEDYKIQESEENVLKNILRKKWAY